MKALDCKTYTEYIECRDMFRSRILLIALVSILWFAVPILLGEYVHKSLYFLMLLTTVLYGFYWGMSFIDGPRNVWFIGINRIKKAIQNREHLKQIRRKAKE
jgi:hypothetical protein